MDLLGGLALLLLLIAAGVMISLSEISFAAARATRVQVLEKKGDRRATRFLALRRQSGPVITVFQICLNAVGVLGGIVGDGLIGPAVARLLAGAGAGRWSGTAGSVVSFCLVTGLFVLFADLLPKRIAMQAPERTALLSAWFPALAVRVLRPVVWLFNRLSDAILREMNIPAATAAEMVTPEDLRAILAAGAESGALAEQEHRLIENVLAMESRSVTSVMTLRDDIVFLDVTEPEEVRREKVRRFPFSRYPVCEGGLDTVLGCARAEDVLATMVDGTTTSPDPARVRRDVLVVPETLNVWEVLAQFQSYNTGFALIVSEYALVVGLVTFKDVMGALMEGLANPFEEQPIVRRDDSSWLVDGIAPMADVVRTLEIDGLGSSGLYETVGGFVMHRLRRVARKTDRVDAAGYRFEVVDVDRARINQLLVTRL
ncbi:MAG: HlyC/CorC family transporter [Gluconacetobacter diazotrophicus]|nr:HlyC/CorC family transporter [Gluconacetobacter diazotrophicus]